MDLYRKLDDALAHLAEWLAEPDRWVRGFHFSPSQRCTRLVSADGVYLHRFKLCPENAVWHPHEWPLATQVLVGSYEHHIGCGREPDRSDLREVGSYRVRSGDRYRLEDPFGWHKIDLVTEEVWSVMVVGPSWLQLPMDYSKLDFGYELKLTPLEREEMLEFLGRFWEVT